MKFFILSVAFGLLVPVQAFASQSTPVPEPLSLDRCSESALPD